MLRAIRFASQLDFTIEAKTDIAIFNNYKLLATVSKERIREELNKFITGYHVQDLFFKFEEIFLFLIPELRDLLIIQENSQRLHNRLDIHTLAVVRNIPKEAGYKFKIAALLHDIGKKNSEVTYDPNGLIPSYHDHAIESEKIARKVLSDLKYSNEDINYICELIKFHDYPLEATKKSIRKLLSKLVYTRDLNDLLTLIIANEKDHIEDFNERKFDLIKTKYKEILDDNEAFSLKDLAINGDDLLDLGYQGKDVSLILDYLLDLVIETPELNTKEILIEKCKNRTVD